MHEGWSRYWSVLTYRWVAGISDNDSLATLSWNIVGKSYNAQGIALVKMKCYRDGFMVAMNYT
ncbi:MAG: hypothetical protein LBC30_02365 [Puniceicoccales bacterium]|nr:hypothetical protein [Puniceicoccales bacterium]